MALARGCHGYHRATQPKDAANRADTAARDGKWVRVHAVLSHEGYDFETAAVEKWVLDVLDVLDGPPLAADVDEDGFPAWTQSPHRAD
jgi:hypothetical protein